MNLTLFVCRQFSTDARIASRRSQRERDVGRVAYYRWVEPKARNARRSIAIGASWLLTMPQCRLCLRDRDLSRSHIVPEYLYRELYNDQDHMMAINGLGQLGWKKQQIGLRERLFCSDCEQHCNRNFETPFLRAWVQPNALGNNWTPNEGRAIQVDYAPFKLFHLCNLYRAAVSSLTVCATVNLGRHHEPIRQMLLNCDPGRDWQYLPLAHAVLHHRTNEPVPLVSFARSGRVFGQRVHGMIYGGCQWWTNVASNGNAEWLEVALRPGGVMPVLGVPWQNIEAIQQASRALRNAPGAANDNRQLRPPFSEELQT